MLKKIVMSSLVVFSASVSISAFSSDLTITNNTQFDSTSVINNGPCSTILGETGITRAGKTNVVPESKVKFACLFNRKNCKADVYMTNNCTGPVIATVIFDTNTGVKNVTMHDASYTVSYTGFTIAMSNATVG